MAASSSSNVENAFQNNFSENGSIAKPPKFNPNNFSLWKSRMMLFMEGMDSRYPTILSEGVVGKVNSDDSSDEEKRLVSLDSKVRSIIAISLPDEVYHSLVNLSTAKEMWSTLCVLYEGTNEVKKSRKIALVRKYELFSYEKGESLSNYYNRFNSLLNDLKLLGRVYDNEEILCKFMDCLPNFWENICTCIKTTKDLDHMHLTVLYGTLFNYEQTKLQRYIKNNSLALLCDSSKKTKCIPGITYPSDSDHDSQEDPNDHSEAYLSDAEDECEETSVDKLSDEMAKLDGHSKSKYDSQKFNQSFSSADFDRAERYKEKYKREKKRNERLVRRGKGLPAKTRDLADEPTSESE